MFDNYTRLSGELRHLAFRQSSEAATWQNALKQQHLADSEYGLEKLSQRQFLVNIAYALHYQFSQWRRTHQQASAMMNTLPSRH
jgi:hypothetical protein